MSAEARPSEETRNLGPCCACGKEPPEWSKGLGTPWTGNVIMLPFKGPSPGSGWGCFMCGLSMEGAWACVCEDCLNVGRPIRFAVDGEVNLKKRVPIETLTIPHVHDMTKHPEVTEGKL